MTLPTSGSGTRVDTALDRRRFLAACTAAGLGSTLLPGVLLTLATQSEARAQAPTPRPTPSAPTASPTTVAAPPPPSSGLPPITPEMIDAAAAIAGLTITDEQKNMMLDGLTQQRDAVVAIRGLPMLNDVAPAFLFDPVPPGMTLDATRKPIKLGRAPDVATLAAVATAGLAGGSDALAFATLREQAELLRTRRITSLALSKMYLGRLRRYDPQLHFVITLTEDRALARAAAADREIDAGHYRGPLHGIPWGAKDLLAVAGYPTTWGAAGFESQAFDSDAVVVQRLDAAGAVLLAKLSMGALAQGDLWGPKPGTRTRNPWNPRQGSSGSSAGSASATAAGCVSFAIGTETLGSISSPSTRCGTTGLRPSFGLVPRTGAMALSWSMDKIGPICRSVEDCAIVLSAIYGPDGHDLATQNAAFNWDATFDWKTLRVGYIKSAFDPPTPDAGAAQPPAGPRPIANPADPALAQAALARRTYDHKFNIATLDILRTRMHVTLIPVEMPKFPFQSIVPVLEAEGAAAFDTLTRSGRDQLLAGQLPFDWPNNFRVARLYSAVDYIQAMRARTLAIGEMTKLFAALDVIVSPSQGSQLTATNLTGQPAIIVPNGIRGDDAPPPPSTDDGALQNAAGPGTPVSITFLGPLYSDARLAAFAHAYQQHTGFHHLHPRLP